MERSQVRQKWVTETWEEYENRIPKREANVHRFFRRQAIREDAAAADVARREAAAERTLAEHRPRPCAPIGEVFGSLAAEKGGTIFFYHF